ncbi:hypothetical protein N7466_005232 [Penicillium verhagenii]|uniref:uncharacterized protein n=1 Tax=Penicillium verhagenii TaxID=1562060 RepID=UPI00254578A6|nr:uncharacterized protein N7466_005232 [Penicillium verhagenii]KAJ5935685.1 hypothetical protein N7466_005232 [Penicillium verhagenii]
MSVVPKYAGMSGHMLSRTVTTVATMGFLLFGYDQGVMSSIIDSDAFFELLPQLNGNSTLQGTVTALYEIVTLQKNIIVDSIRAYVLHPSNCQSATNL